MVPVTVFDAWPLTAATDPARPETAPLPLVWLNVIDRVLLAPLVTVERKRAVKGTVRVRVSPAVRLPLADALIAILTAAPWTTVKLNGLPVARVRVPASAAM